MKIANNNLTNIFKKSHLTPVGDFSCSFARLKSQPSKDCFVRSTNLITQITNKQRIQSLYDDAYTDVLNFMSTSNPVISKLNLTKPELQIKKIENPNNDAIYRFSDNIIQISEKIFDNCEYLVVTLDSSGNIESCFSFSSEENKDRNLTEAKKLAPNVALVRLTDEEKEIHVKSVIAHELRHFVQNHLIASTKNCGEKQKAGIDNFLKESKDALAKAKEEYKQACKKLGQEPIKEFITENKRYYETFTPQQILPDDISLKFSSFEDDNRYFSVKDHLLKSQLGTASTDCDDDYYSSALEIDAYNFSSEYLLVSPFDKKNVREKIIAALSLFMSTNRDKGIEIMNKKGINFIQK